MPIASPIGRLWHRLTIEEPNATQDSAGQPIPNWRAISTVWAEILPIAAAEGERGASVEATVTHRVTIRHIGDLSPTMRLKRSDGRILNISKLYDPDGFRRWMVIEATEIQPAAS